MAEDSGGVEENEFLVKTALTAYKFAVLTKEALNLIVTGAWLCSLAVPRWTITFRRGRLRIFVCPITAEAWLWLLIDVEAGGRRLASGRALSEADALAEADRAARRLRGVRSDYCRTIGSWACAGRFPRPYESKA
jgi:hypothetical protein